MFYDELVAIEQTMAMRAKSSKYQRGLVLAAYRSELDPVAVVAVDPDYDALHEQHADNGRKRGHGRIYREALGASL